MNTMLSSHLLQPQPGCGCPACSDLTCMERPRFFAGQLLTEAETLIAEYLLGDLA